MLRRAIIMGAGEAARLLVSGLPQQGWTVLGLLDDDPAKRGARISGAPVLGRLDELSDPRVIAGATHIITALPSATAAQRRRAIELAASHDPAGADGALGQRAAIGQRARRAHPSDRAR